jgi:DNA helicase HerA-like ATPase
MEALDKLRLKIILQYFDDIFRGYSNKDHLASLVKRMDNRIEDLKKVITIGDSLGERNFTVVSLKDVNIHLRKILPLLLCKRLYDDKKSDDDGETYLNIIIDEAHNILSEDSTREIEQWKDYRLETFEEIIKEGRKFGVFLTLASQRPADISPTIISQLHNYFLHRLINEQDIKAVERTISYLDKVSFEYLPILPTGTCVFAGLLANVPVIVDIDEMDAAYEPKNKTRTLTDKWH